MKIKKSVHDKHITEKGEQLLSQAQMQLALLADLTSNPEDALATVCTNMAYLNATFTALSTQLDDVFGELYVTPNKQSQE